MKYSFFKCLILTFELLFACNNYGSSFFNSCAMNADGKILMVGMQQINQTQAGIIHCYDDEGKLDEKFGNGGIITVTLGTVTQFDTILMVSNKILVGGFVLQDNVSKILIGRFNNDGMLDTSFGTDQTGWIIEQIGDGASVCSLSCGKKNTLVAAGNFVQSGCPQIFINYYSVDGMLDSKLDKGHSFVFSNECRLITKTMGYCPQDDAFVLAGYCSDGHTQEKSFLFRVDSKGKFDTSFGTKGYTILDDTHCSHINVLKILSDGKILVSGITQNKSMISQFLADGQSDKEFGISGIITDECGNVSEINDMAIDSMNRIIVTGTRDNQMFIARYLANGILDSTFNMNGRNIFTHSSSSSAQGITILPNKIIVCAGQINMNHGGFAYNFCGEFVGCWIESMCMQPEGLAGSTGFTGNSGPTGHTGAIGSTGVNGSDAANITNANYAFCYSITTQDIIKPNQFQDITFDTNSVINGWTRTGTTFTCTQSGIYQICYRALADNVSLLALGATTMSFNVLKGPSFVEIPGSQASVTMGALLGQRIEANNSFLVAFNTGDLIKFQMSGSNTNNQITAGNGSGTVKPSFAACITRIA